VQGKHVIIIMNILGGMPEPYHRQARNPAATTHDDSAASFRAVWA